MCALSLLQECRVWLAYDHPPRARPFASICDVRGTAWYAMALCHDNVALIALLLLLLLLLSLLSRFGGDPRVHTVSSCRVVLCVSCQMTSQRGGAPTWQDPRQRGKKRQGGVPTTTVCASPRRGWHRTTGQRRAVFAPLPFFRLFFVAHIAHVRRVRRRPTAERTQRPSIGSAVS